MTTLESVSNEQIELLPCPFCGSTDIDPQGWATTGGIAGPACNACQAAVGSALLSTAENIAAWNRRAFTGGVTSGEVVTDEMVERAGAAIWDSLIGTGVRLTRDDVANYSEAARAALTAALSEPLHELPEASAAGQERDSAKDNEWYARKAGIEGDLEIGCGFSMFPPPAFNGCICSCHRGSGIIHMVACCAPTHPGSTAQPQETGSREAVAGYLFDLRYGPDNWSRQRMFSTALPSNPDDVRNVTPLFTLSQLQAVERERDALTDILKSSRKALAWEAQFIRAETAEASLAAAEKRTAELERVLRPFSLATDVINISYRVTEKHLADARAALAGSNGE